MKVRIRKTNRDQRAWVLEEIREVVLLYPEMMTQARTEGQAGQVGRDSQHLSLTTMIHSESDDIS
jgi:hypothetical protein